MFEYMPYNLAPWGVEIVIYFFIIGLAAMTFIMAAAPETFGNVAAPFRNVEIPGAVITLILLGISGPLLIADISQPLRFLNPIIYFRPTSPLSWGSVLLLLFGAAVVAFLYGRFFDKPGIRRAAAVIGSLLALSMPIYTGIDLAANQARALWATPAIPLLFVALSVTSGAGLVAVIQLVTGNFGPDASRMIRTIMAFSLAVTFLLVFALVQTMVYGTAELQQAWDAINGEFSVQFWWLGIILGIVIPLILVLVPILAPRAEAARSPLLVAVAGVLGALGAYMLREVIIYAGQLPQLFF